MRNRALHDSLRDFTLEAAALLSSEVAAGHEIPFELVEEPGSGPVLYRYRPLTDQYIGERWAALRALPSCERAAGALGSGAAAYLRVQGAPDGPPDAEPALRAMLERLWEDATSFGFPEERFERVYADVERTLYENTLRAAVVTPLPGVELERERVELGEGLVLISGTGSEAPAEAVWPLPGDRERGAPPNTLCLLERDVSTSDGAPVTEARLRFRRLLTAMRLYKAGAVAIGPLAWARSGPGPWQPLPLAPAGYARGEPWALRASEEAGLRDLLGVLEGTRPGGAIGWALARLEMGCERPLDSEALSDYLLALRALLDPPPPRDDPSGANGRGDGGSFVLRLAALCAEEDQRRAVQRRIETALALERFLIGGAADTGAYIDEVGPVSPRDVVLALEENLRAVLQDVICGYLDSDLRKVADEILLTSHEPVEIHARDTRTEDTPDAGAAHEPNTSESDAAHEADTDESEAVREEPAAEDEQAAEPDDDVGPDDDSGVTPSADWELDEDAASYSAPV